MTTVLNLPNVQGGEANSECLSGRRLPRLPWGGAVNSRDLFTELKRRNVCKVAIAYAVVAWLLMQVASQIFPFFEIPNWAVRLVVLLLIIGFPVALILAWAFELTPEGIKRAEDADLSKSIALKTRNLTTIVRQAIGQKKGGAAYCHALERGAGCAK